MNDVHKVKETPYEAVESRKKLDTFDLCQVHIEDGGTR